MSSSPLSEDLQYNASGMDAEDDDTELVKNEAAMPSFMWEDHGFQRQTMNALNMMRQNKQFCDVILRIGKQDIMAHRVVLAAASPYFVELFARDVGGPTRKEVEGGGIVYELQLESSNKEALEVLIDYAYTSILRVPGELLRPVFMAATVLRLDRASNQCARYMALNMNLTSSLEIRSSSCMAATAFDNHATSHSNGLRQTWSSSREETSSVNNISAGIGEANDCSYANGNSSVGEENYSSIDLVKRVDQLIASTELSELQSNRGFLTLPRFCVEVLHSTKEERDAVKPQPLCELVLDWAHKAWLDDKSIDIDETFLQKSSLLIMSKDNSLVDCKEVEEGSPHDSDLIQDYKKSNQHLDKPKTGRPRVGRRGAGNATVKPAKPREMLFASRHINHQIDNIFARSEYSEQYRWKVIAAHRLDNKTIMAVVSLDAKLIILSLVQRINVPTCSSPTSMLRSSSEGSLRAAGLQQRSPGDKSNHSRPPSIEREVYVPVASMKYAKCAAGVVAMGNNLVVCGGFDRGECLNKVEAFSLSENKWNKWPPMLSKRGRFDATVVKDTVIFAVGGSNGHSEEASCELYDQESGKWTFGPSLPIGLSNIGLCSWDGTVYCIGGSNGSTGSKFCFKLKPNSSKWERIADLQVGRFQAAVVAHDGRIWAVGGCESWNPLNSLEIYDPLSDSWSFGPSLNTPRRGCGLAVRKGQLVVVGGTDGTQSMCTTEVLDVEENAWHPGPTMTFCRGNVSVAVVHDRLWAVGGFSGKTFLNTVEFLDPRTEEWTNYITVECSKDSSDVSEAKDEDMVSSSHAKAKLGERVEDEPDSHQEHHETEENNHKNGTEESL